MPAFIACTHKQTHTVLLCFWRPVISIINDSAHLAITPICEFWTSLCRLRRQGVLGHGQYSNTSQRSLVGLRTRFCTGQLSSSTPLLGNHGPCYAQGNYPARTSMGLLILLKGNVIILQHTWTYCVLPALWCQCMKYNTKLYCFFISDLQKAFHTKKHLASFKVHSDSASLNVIALLCVSY